MPPGFCISSFLTPFLFFRLRPSFRLKPLYHFFCDFRVLSVFRCPASSMFFPYSRNLHPCLTVFRLPSVYPYFFALPRAFRVFSPVFRRSLLFPGLFVLIPSLRSPASSFFSPGIFSGFQSAVFFCSLFPGVFNGYCLVFPMDWRILTSDAQSYSSFSGSI